MKKSVVEDFKKKTETALANVRSQEQIREEDKMVDEVFKIAKFLFANDLDRIGEPVLVKLGGRLTGIFAYLGNISARARAERDIYEQKKEEVIAELSVKLYKDSEKITLAKLQAKLEVSPLEELVAIKEFEKNNYENLLNAIDKMVGFIQSAIKVKSGEKFKSNQNYNNG